jgi:hypothetical protein
MAASTGYGVSPLEERLLQPLLALAALAVAAFIALFTLRQVWSGEGIVAPAVLLSGLLLLPLIWRRPQVSLYLLAAGAVVADGGSLGFGLSFTDRLPLFDSLSAILDVPGLVLNVAEMLPIVTLAALFLRRLLGRGGFETGPLLVPMVALAGLLLLGLLRGVGAGGDPTVALWGIRGLLILCAVYFLSVNLLVNAGQVRLLFLLVMLAVAFKAVVGLWRFLVDLGGDLSRIERIGTVNSLMSHDESYFYLLPLLALTAAMVMGLHGSIYRRLPFAVGLLAFVPLLANQRRAGIAALILAGLLLLCVAYALKENRRAAFAVLSTLAAAFVLLFGAATWNDTSLLGAPTQAVKSGFEPSERDLSSNNYREAENANLRFTARQDPLLGIGFGRPLVQAQPLPDISGTYAWYEYLPHNGFLWLLMTMGLGGMSAFFYLTASAVYRGAAALRRSVGPRERATLAFALMAVAMFLVFGLFDQGLLSQRLAIFNGLLFALLAVGERLFRADELREGVLR